MSVDRPTSQSRCCGHGRREPCRAPEQVLFTVSDGRTMGRPTRSYKFEGECWQMYDIPAWVNPPVVTTRRILRLSLLAMMVKR